VDNVYRFTALGTEWGIETTHELPVTLKHGVDRRLEEYDKAYSRFRDDSIVAAMRRGAGRYDFPDDFVRLFSLYSTLYRLTGGRMTPLIGSALEQAGYDQMYSLEVGEITEVPALDKVIHWGGASTIDTDRPIVFDVGAAGKGYAVDLIAEMIQAGGIDVYMIDASGDMRHRGKQGEVIGLEHPFDPKKVIGTVRLNNQSLCASSINRRAWRGLHHVFDPTTLSPVTGVVASWVVADDTLTADGLATALFFVDDPSDLQREFDFSFVRLFSDGSVDYTPGFEGELYI
jgi:thiamine biosynthesis lipoprotein